MSLFNYKDDADDGKSQCTCADDTASSDSISLDISCECPKDDHNLVRHEQSCNRYRNKNILFGDDPDDCACEDETVDLCKCCYCPLDKCRCVKPNSEDLETWRKNRPMGALPAVLEANHPLMQKFQQTLKQFLERENEIAEKELKNLRNQLKDARTAYDTDLEAIYKSDHDTNAQRKMIEEYEANLAQMMQDRKELEDAVGAKQAIYKEAKEKLEKNVQADKESLQEIEALNLLCQQLEEWRKETDDDLSVTNRVTDKIKREKAIIASQKRQLDMMIYGLNTEVWKLEAKMELYKKQIEIKTNELDKVNDRAIAYTAELEDLDLDKRRLVSLWNSVIVNIHQRDKVFDSVREDYNALQENYHTLLINLDVTKKLILEEMYTGKVLGMERDKNFYDINSAQKQYDSEQSKHNALESRMDELTEAINMCERDIELVKVENHQLRLKMTNLIKESDKKSEQKVALENQILLNLQECLLNDKAVQSMANGIRKLRDMSRKQEITLMSMENQHAKVLYDIEIYRTQQEHNDKILEERNAEVAAKEKVLEDLEIKYENKTHLLMRKQRELDIITNKYFDLKRIFDHQSPQAVRISDLEDKIHGLSDRTEELQDEWVRLQGYVVKMSAQHQNILNDVNIINKQIQICAQKSMRIQVNCDTVEADRDRVERSIRILRQKIEALQRIKYEALQRNNEAELSTIAISNEYLANLKDAENNVFQLEQDIEDAEKEKETLAKQLDMTQREALIWQRKGILALDLKRNIIKSKADDGELGQMKSEIHRMELRQEQLHRIADRLSNDLAQCISRREVALDKTRAQAAAVEKALVSGHTTSQSQYKHKLRLARSDMTRVAKEVKQATSRIDFLEKEQERLENEIAEVYENNSKLEETVATLIRRTVKAEQYKQRLLERAVRNQRMANELRRAIKRQSLKVRKPKSQLSTEYSNHMTFNERLRAVIDHLLAEFPHVEDKLVVIGNTLSVHSPSASPRMLTPDCLCGQDDCKCLRDACYCPRLGSAHDVPERDIPHNIDIIEEGLSDAPIGSPKALPENPQSLPCEVYTYEP